VLVFRGSREYISSFSSFRSS